MDRKRSLRDSGSGLTRSWRGTLPSGGRDAWRQVLILFTSFIAYDAIRILASGREEAAMENAQRLISGERLLNIYWEPWLQARASYFDAVIHFFNFFYSNAHLPATALILAWIYLYRHETFAYFRNVFLTINFVGLAIFTLVPVAPPRLVLTSGIVDTVYLYSDARVKPGVMGFVTNPYAAMPSLHLGYAIFLSVALWLLCRQRSVRVFAVVYSLLVLLAIVITGNHYFLDAVGGAFVVGFAFVATWALSSREVLEFIVVPGHDESGD